MEKRIYDYDFISDLADRPEKSKNAGIIAEITGFLAPFYPKSVMCRTAYLSMLGSFGIAKLSSVTWLFPALLLCLILHLWAVSKNIKQRIYLPFVFSLTGALLIVISRTFSPLTQWTVIVGMFLVFSGALTNCSAHFKTMEGKEPVR